MRIIELYIERFGGLANLNTPLESGLNLVYGENEAGKSTVFSFIRAMFYGLTGNARRIAENERKHRLPWGHDRMGGWLSFEHAGRTYRIERTFGNTRRQDQRVLRDDISGKPVDLPGAQEIGEWLFSVREAEFLNTVCIGQLASAAVMPEDSTLAKLANLAATGDERVSAAEVDARLRKAMVAYRAEKGSGGRINQLTARQQDLLGERQETLARETERSDCFRQFQHAVHERETIDSLIVDGRCLQQACRDRAAIRLASQRAGRVAELHRLEHAASLLGSSLKWDGRLLSWVDLSELQARRDRLVKGLARQDEIDQQHGQRIATLSTLQARKSAYAEISAVDATASLQLLDEADQLEQDAWAMRQRLLTVGELQGSQSAAVARRSEAQSHCEAAQQALDEHQELSAAELKQAEQETGRRHQAWESCGAALAERRSVHEATVRKSTREAADRTAADQKTDASGNARPAQRRANPLLLAVGLLLILAGLVGGIAIAPAVFVLIPLGIVAIGLPLWQNRRSSVQPADGSAPDSGALIPNASEFPASDPLLAQLDSQAEALKRDWAESAERLDGLRNRLAQRERRLSLELETCHQAWLAAAAQERQAAASWQAVLAELQQNASPGLELPAISAISAVPAAPAGSAVPGPDDSASIDSAFLCRQTQAIAASLSAGKAILKQRQADVRQSLAAMLADAGCATADTFRQKLDELHELDREEAQVHEEILQLLVALDAVAAANASLERSLRDDLQPLVGVLDSQVEMELDQMLETVRQRLTELETGQTAIREKRQSLGDLSGHQDQGESGAETETAKISARLAQAYPDGDDGLASALSRFSRSAAIWLSPLESGWLDLMEAKGPAAVIDAGAGQLPALLDSLMAVQGNFASEAVRLESELTHRFSQLRSIEDIDLDLAMAERQLQKAQAEYAALALARNAVDEAFRELQQSFGPQLNRRGGDIMARLSGGHYADMRVDRNLQIAVPDPRTGQLHEADYLSGGTMDQAYLSLRLAVSELIAGPSTRLPLLLDDVLMQYDDNRAAAGLAFLRQYAEEQDLQILLFTCHGRLLAPAGAAPAGRGCHVIRLS